MNPFIVPIVLLSAVSTIFIILNEEESPEISPHIETKYSEQKNVPNSNSDITIDYTKSKKLVKPIQQIKFTKEDKRNYLITEERSKNGLYYIKVYSSSINSTKISGDITIQGLIGNEEYKLIIPASIKNNIRLVVTDSILDSTYEVPFDFKKLSSGKVYEVSFQFNQVEKIIEEEIGFINNKPNPFN